MQFLILSHLYRVDAQSVTKKSNLAGIKARPRKNPRGNPARQHCSLTSIPPIPVTRVAGRFVFAKYQCPKHTKSGLKLLTDPDRQP